MKSHWAILTAGLFLYSCTQTTENKQTSEQNTDSLLMAEASRLARELLIIDTHIDAPSRLFDKWEDISVRAEGGEFDYERAKTGGLDAAFMSIYIDAHYQGTPGAAQHADSLIDMVTRLAKDHPEKFSLAFSSEDVIARSKEGKICLPMGMENGAPVESLEKLKYYYDLGIRYITLTHGKDNHICDSSYDKEHKWNGVSPFGEKLIAGMNRLGIIIDVSHLSDSAFYDVIRLSKAPVAATHSSCRYFTPGWERNMSDDMIRELAKNGGVIQINFGSAFLNDAFCKTAAGIKEQVEQFREENKLAHEDPKVGAYKKSLYKKADPKLATIREVADHIDHVVKLAGIDHVGIGSDFDGVGPTLPDSLNDASCYPNLIYELLKRGYKRDEIEKICSGNFLRVWKRVEEFAMRGTGQ